jgi:hypothetical protein
MRDMKLARRMDVYIGMGIQHGGGQQSGRFWIDHDMQ